MFLSSYKSESLHLLCGNHILVLLKDSEVDIINDVYKVRLKDARSLTKVSELLRCTAWSFNKVICLQGSDVNSFCSISAHGADALPLDSEFFEGQALSSSALHPAHSRCLLIMV